jgi:hypothetical protein
MPLPEITTTNIRALKAFQVAKNQYGNWDPWNCRPVWLVELKGSDHAKLVVKAEVAAQQGAAKSIRFGAKIMHKLDEETKAAPLSNNELAALGATQQMRFCARGQAAQGGELGVDYLNYVRTAGAIYTWVKMRFVQNLVDLEGVVKNQTNARNLLLDMRMYPEILESLGEVVAGDIFIGNEDRFSHGGKGELGTIVNQGNILFRKTTNGLRGIGLDWFEAQGTHSNLNKEPPPDWHGTLLNDEVRLQVFAKNAIDGINEVFFNKMPDLAADELLTMQNVDNFCDGLLSGSRKLQKYLSDRRNSLKVVPSGVVHRMQRLKWA